MSVLFGCLTFLFTVLTCKQAHNCLIIEQLINITKQDFNMLWNIEFSKYNIPKQTAIVFALFDIQFEFSVKRLIIINFFLLNTFFLSYVIFICYINNI